MKRRWLLLALLGCSMLATIGFAACTPQEETGGTQQPGGTEQPETPGGTEQPETPGGETEQPETPGGETEQPEHTHAYVGGVCSCGEQDATFTGEAVGYALEGGVYTGDMTAGKPNGTGRIQYESGDSYSGGWADGVYSGEGKYTFSGGMYYEGDYVNGKREGEGVFSWSTDGNPEHGWLFTGTFADDKATFGRTETRNTNGIVWYEGAMNDLNDVKTSERGTGYFVYADSGCTYTGGMTAVGALTEIKFDGTGKFTWAQSDFEGTYANGVPVSGTKTFYTDESKQTKTDVYVGEVNAEYKYHGEGTCSYPNGHTYSGGWSNDLFHGQGRYTFANGMYYEGDYVNGKREGEGVFSWSTDGNPEHGWLFTGTFANDKATFGRTETRNTNGIVWYEGAMNDLNDVKTSERGTGYFVYADSGCTYTGGMTAAGALTNIKFDGTGKFTWPICDFEGTYENGVPVSGTKTFYTDASKQTKADVYVGEVNAAYEYHGNGTCTYPSGDKYSGSWNKNVFHGQGRYTFANGMYYEGGYVNGKREGEGIFTWSTDGNLANGWLFEGTFANGEPTFGKKTTNRNKGLIWYEGSMKTLDVVDTTKPGTGYYDYGNGCWYEGGMTVTADMAGCTFVGEGTFSWAKELGTGTYIVGTFANSAAVSGTKYWPKRTTGLTQYTGAFQNTDNIDTTQPGEGRYVFANGDVYEGGLQVTQANGSACTLTGTGLMTYAASQVTGADFGLSDGAEAWTLAACYGEFVEGKLAGSAVLYFTLDGAPAGYLTGTFTDMVRSGAVAEQFEYTLLTGYEGFTDSAPVPETA